MTDWTIDELAGAIRVRKVSAAEVTADCLARIGRLDGRLRAFITVDAEGALACARDLDADAEEGRWRGPPHGVPLAYKDLCYIRGLPTSCGTKTVTRGTYRQPRGPRPSRRPGSLSWRPWPPARSAGRMG